MNCNIENLTRAVVQLRFFIADGRAKRMEAVSHPVSPFWIHFRNGTADRLTVLADRIRATQPNVHEHAGSYK
jgi:hypothetical protein